MDEGRAYHPGFASQPGTKAIELHGVSKRFGSRLAVDDMSLVVDRGSVLGFVGLNGAGKTTTIRMLLGLLAPSAGRALILGAPYRDRRELGLVGGFVDRPAFPPHLTVHDALCLFGRVGGLEGKRLTDATNRALESLGCVPFARRRIRELSSGMRQRLGLALAFLGEPQVIILDEPTEGLDPDGVATLRGLVLDRARAGAAVMFSSHLLPEVEHLADRIAIVHKGRLVANAPRESIGEPSALRVRFSNRLDRELAERLLVARDLICRDDQRSEHTLIVTSADGAHVNQFLASHEVFAAEISLLRPSLEETLLALAGSQGADRAT
jgi:ABC-2 type transport system ATP-binding protein